MTCFSVSSRSCPARRALRENQEEKMQLESELGGLSRKVHELQLQITDRDKKKERKRKEDDDDDDDEDILEVSMAGKPLW
jgi:hypothetical protein